MTLDEYQVLTGESVPSNRLEQLEAQLTRTQRILEASLGYPLDSSEIANNQYNETGKATSTDWPCLAGWGMDEFIWGSDGTGELAAPDPVENAYRMFDYNPKDRFLRLDPFSTIHAIKFVRDDVTVATIDPDDYRIHWGRETVGTERWSRDVEIQCGWWRKCDCTSCFQIAVDANWMFEEIPEELKYLWADMVSYYMNPKSDIKSESIGAHSYSRFDNVLPQELAHNVSVIKRYAGPHGTAFRSVTL